VGHYKSDLRFVFRSAGDVPNLPRLAVPFYGHVWPRARAGARAGAGAGAHSLGPTGEGLRTGAHGLGPTGEGVRTRSSSAAADGPQPRGWPAPAFPACWRSSGSGATRPRASGCRREPFAARGPHCCKEVALAAAAAAPRRAEDPRRIGAQSRPASPHAAPRPWRASDSTVRPQHEFTPRSWRQLCPPLPDPDTAVANDCRMPRKGGKEFQLERAELLRLRPRQWLSDPVVNLYTECPRARARPSSCSLPPCSPPRACAPRSVGVQLFSLLLLAAPRWSWCTSTAAPCGCAS
jgi:hypothetical protein